MIYKHLRFDSSWRWSYPKLYFSGLLFLLHTHDVSCPFIKADLIYLVFYLSQWWFHLLIKESIQVCCKVQQLYWSADDDLLLLTHPHVVYIWWLLSDDQVTEEEAVLLCEILYIFICDVAQIYYHPVSVRVNEVGLMYRFVRIPWTYVPTWTYVPGT